LGDILGLFISLLASTLALLIIAFLCHVLQLVHPLCSALTQNVRVSLLLYILLVHLGWILINYSHAFWFHIVFYFSLLRKLLVLKGILQSLIDGQVLASRRSRGLGLNLLVMFGEADQLVREAGSSLGREGLRGLHLMDRMFIRVVTGSFRVGGVRHSLPVPRAYGREHSMASIVRSGLSFDSLVSAYRQG